MQKTTDQLMNEIQNSHEIEKFFENNNGEFTEKPLCDHLEHLLKEKKLQKSKVVARSGLNRIYGYQILSGKRVPSRDKLIALCFGMQLDIDETDDLLKYAGYNPLYARNKRDSIIIFAISNKKSIFTTNEMLFDNDFEILNA